MSRRNLRKLEKQTQPQSSNGEESDHERYVVKKNKFDFADLEDSPESEKEESTIDLPFVEKATQEKPGPITKKEEKKEEDLTYLLQELGIDESQPTETTDKRYESVLKRQAKHFNSEAEINKKFRTSTVQSRVRTTRPMRRMVLTPTAVHWPTSVEYGLVMEVLEPGSEPVFTLQTSRGYQKTQEEFLQCVESNDPNALQHFLQTHPFHTEALFQLCLFYLLQSNYEQADVLLQRLLYAFQLSFHHQFSVVSTDVRLAYGHSLFNKVLFQSLFMQVDILGRKGCSRTALEFSKLLLSLDPVSDPLGSLFLVEYFTLRCKKVISPQYDYFLHFALNFTQEFHGRGHLIWMPNILYSVAWVKCMEEGNNPHMTLEDVTKASELLSIEAILKANSSSVLILAINLYPVLALSLLQKLEKKTSVRLIQTQLRIGDPSHVAEVYVERCGDLWKAENTANWLKTAYEVAGNVSEGVRERWLEMIDLPFSLDRYSTLDKARFSDTVQTAVPQELLMAGGPQFQRAPHPRGNLSRHMHPFLLFFATLLPWNSVDFGPE